MSLALLDRWPDIQASLIYHATSGMSLRSCSKISSSISRALDVQPFLECNGAAKVEQTVKALVLHWCQINHRHFFDKHEQKRRTRTPTKISTKGKVISLVQLLKFLQCAHYNTSTPSDGEEAALEQLRRVTDALVDTIISEMPEYRAAEWF